MLTWGAVGDPAGGTVCKAATLPSAVAALVPFVAVANPCKTAGAVAPVSAISGMVLRLVPLGTFSTTVALYGTLLEFTQPTPLPTVPVASGKNRRFRFRPPPTALQFRPPPGCRARPWPPTL